MATANVLITFSRRVAVTINEDKKWSVSSDPGGLLDVEGGIWKYDCGNAKLELLQQTISLRRCNGSVDQLVDERVCN